MGGKSKTYLALIVMIGALVAFFVFKDNIGVTDGLSDYGSYGGSRIDDETALTRNEAVSEYWDEIKEYVDGTETLEACSSESGNCYDLDADISDGVIDQIYFPNGGYLYFSADIDESGYASDFDQDGNNWDFTIDMHSSMVDDAIENWANSNGYTIE